MAIKLLLPGADRSWVLPEDWTDAHLRFAWNGAREAGEELRIELNSGDILIVYPAQVAWYAITGTPSADPGRCPETTERFMTGGRPFQCVHLRDHDGAHEFEPGL